MTQTRIDFSALPDVQLAEILEAKVRKQMTLEDAILELADGPYRFPMPSMKTSDFNLSFEQMTEQWRKSKRRHVIRRLQSIDRRLSAIGNNPLLTLSSDGVLDTNVAKINRRLGIALQALFAPLRNHGKPFISMADLRGNITFETMSHDRQLQVLRVRDEYMHLTYAMAGKVPLTYTEWLARSTLGPIPTSVQMWIHEVNFDGRMAVSRLLGMVTFDKQSDCHSLSDLNETDFPHWSLAGLRERTCTHCGRGTLSTSDMCSDCRPISSSRRGESGRPRRRVTENDSPIDHIEDKDDRNSYHGETNRDDI